jgi:general secretion pathway protein K
VALMMVLWIFMVLTVLVAEFGRGMRDDAIATQNMAEEVQARGVAFAAIGQAIYRSMHAREEGEDIGLEDDVERWPADGSWHEGHYGGGTYRVRLTDEGGKIPLNRADENLLRRVLGNVGLDADSQEEVADAILDWRDDDDLKRLHGAEAEYYLGLPEPYEPMNGPFDAPEDLLLVRGVTREMMFGGSADGLGRNEAPAVPLREVFSTFNKTANINVRTAPPAVLRVLLGGGEADVDEVVEARAADPDSALTLMRAKVGDPTVARRLVDRTPRIIAIDARAVMEGAQIQARVGAVVEIGEDSDGFHIMRWFDRLPAI